MNEYDYPTATAKEPEPDPRIVAVHRVVDLERQYEQAVRDSEQRQKMAAIAREELREAQNDLAGLLGYPSNGNKLAAMSGEEARAIAERMNR